MFRAVDILKIALDTISKQCKSRFVEKNRTTERVMSLMRAYIFIPKDTPHKSNIMIFGSGLTGAMACVSAHVVDCSQN
jgi:hypothetical protein